MKTISKKAYAKINLSLDVVGKREDNYHMLRMIMQEIGLYDTVSITALEVGESDQDQNISLTCSSPFLPITTENIAFRAAELMQKTFNLKNHYRIHIDKRIPVAAGLAGGSTDAAAVMTGIRQLENIEVSDDELMTLSLALGSDIPFCIKGGTALAEGIGEIIRPIEASANYWVLLVKPALGVSTPHVYKNLKWQDVAVHPSTDALIGELRQANLHRMAPLMANVLESVTAVEHPIIYDIQRQLLAYGAVVSKMSGSGPSVFGLFKRDDLAKRALKNMKRYYQQVYLVRPIVRRDV